MPPEPGWRRPARRILPSLLLLPALSTPATAGEFVVTPTRLELGGAIRSGALTLRNEDRVPLRFQVRGVRWTQDAQGQEQYADSTDLIYFPRQLVVAPGEEGVIRVGVRPGEVATEKTYRVFIDEQPAPDAAAPAAGAQVRVLLRFGAPVFVAPAQPTQRLVLEAPALEAGQVRWRVRNEGNRHELFQEITVRGLDRDGQEVLREQRAERYLLAGDDRQFTLPVAAPACARLTRVVVRVVTDKSEAQREASLDAPACP